jgi:hemerythrin-like domain-containing protein
MKAIDILRTEHTILERVLVTLDVAAVGAAHQKPVRPGFFIDAYGFVLDFTEGYHFKKEEDVLFKVLATHGLPIEGGEIGSLIGEHQHSHTYILAMLEAARLWDTHDEQAKAEVIWATSGYTSLLHTHISRENNVLFNLVAQETDKEEQYQIAEEFEKINHLESGENLHEKYLQVATHMEQESAEWK